MSPGSYIFTSSLPCALYFCLVYFIRATYLNDSRNVGRGLFSENNVLFFHVFYVGIDQCGVITLPLLISRCCHYTYLLLEMCIILVSTSWQRYQLFPLMLEHAVVISTYVQHCHRDLAKDSYYLTEGALRLCGD